MNNVKCRYWRQGCLLFESVMYEPQSGAGFASTISLTLARRRHFAA